jgi:cysteine-rich repeat protein
MSSARGAAGGGRGGSWRLALGLLGTACGGDDGRSTGGETTVATTSATATVSAESTEGSTDATQGSTAADPSTSSLDDDSTGEPTTGNPTTGETPQSCGDGTPDEGEACDDGNEVDSDGCNVDCTISGSVLWFHSQAGGAGQSEDAFGVAVDAEGRAYVGGEIWGAADLDFWVRQYEDDGLGWTQSFDGGGGNDGARAVTLRGSNLYVAGYTVAAGQSNNVWLRSFGLDGAVAWTVAYDDALNGSNVGQGVAADPGGNVIVAANELVGDPMAPQADAWMREYSAAGAPVWTVGYGGAALSTDTARAVATDAAGRVAAVGSETVAGQGTDMWIRVYDTNGGVQWTALYGNANALDDEAMAVAFDGDGNVIVAGYELDPVIPWRLWLTKYDPAGVPLWSQTWDGELLEGARAFGVAVDDIGDIVVTGQHRAAGVNQLLVRKLDPAGNERWVTNIDGFAGTSQVGRAVAIGPGRRVWVAGGVDQGVDGRDAYVARLAP